MKLFPQRYVDREKEKKILAQFLSHINSDPADVGKSYLFIFVDNFVDNFFISKSWLVHCMNDLIMDEDYSIGIIKNSYP